MKHASPSYVWHARADIPNSKGFRFVGLMTDDTEEICAVVCRPDGTHTLANDAFPRLAKWRAIPAGEITARPYCQASFTDASGVLVQSFALLRQRPDGSGEAVAVLDCEGSEVVRDMAINQIAARARGEPLIAGNVFDAFRAAIRSVLQSGKPAPYASGNYGPELRA